MNISQPVLMIAGSLKSAGKVESMKFWASAPDKSRKDGRPRPKRGTSMEHPVIVEDMQVFTLALKGTLPLFSP
jgi:hypothetical protein